MSTRVFALALAVCACSTSLACDTPAPSARAREQTPPAQQAGAAPAEPAAAPAPGEVPEGGVSAMPEGEPPPWFSPEAFAHEQVIRQDGRSNKLPTGQFSRMILLELAAGTTPEQCIGRVEAKLGESMSELPEHSETPQGYLMLQGKFADYEYNVVCGMAKGAPTLFLSYVQ